MHPLDHERGARGASVTLVEYGDYQCPHCARAQPLITALLSDLAGAVRFVFRNFPLADIHPNASHAAQAAESAAAHGGNASFWTMHDTIFNHQQDSATALEDMALARYASGSGVDGAVVLRDLRSRTFESLVRSDFVGGLRSRVHGTPTFFINGWRYDGRWDDYVEFGTALARAADQMDAGRTVRV